MKKRKNHPILMAIAGIIYAATVIICIAVGVANLVGTGTAKMYENVAKHKHVSGKVVIAKEIITYKHTINSLIPLGTEHYYLVAGEDGDNYCVIRADESWYDDNFDENGLAKNSLEISGNVSGYSSKMKSNIKKFNQKNINLGIKADESKFVDIMYIRYSLIKILAGVFNIVGGLLCLVAYKNAQRPDYVPVATSGKRNYLIICGIVCIIVGALLVAKALIIW